MSGKIDHPILHPKLEALLEQDRANPAPPLSALPMATARAAFREMARSVGGTGPEMGRVVTTGFDPLRDEAESLGHAIIAAGGSAEIVRHAAYVHGFLSLPALLPDVATIMAGHASALGSALRAAKDS